MDPRKALYRPSAVYGTGRLLKRDRIIFWVFILLFLWIVWRSFTVTATTPPAVNQFPSTASASAEIALADFLGCNDISIPTRVDDQLEALLSSGPAPVPEETEGEQVVAPSGGCSPTSFSSLSFRRWQPVEGSSSREIHTFAVDSERGLLEARVLVDADGRDVVLAAIPTIVRIDLQAGEVPSEGVPVNGTPGSFDRDQALTRAQAWTAAYLNRDVTSMLDITDQRRDEVVHPDAQADSGEIILFDPLGQDTLEDVVRVRTVILDSRGFTHSFDLFFDRLDEAQPSVAGWGAPGERAGFVLGQ